MATELIGYKPDYAVPPGETLLEALQEAGLTQTELAHRTGLSAQYVDRLVKGRVPLSGVVAVELEQALGIPSQFWNSRESDYRSRLNRLARRPADEKPYPRTSPQKPPHTMSTLEV